MLKVNRDTSLMQEGCAIMEGANPVTCDSLLSHVAGDNEITSHLFLLQVAVL